MKISSNSEVVMLESSNKFVELTWNDPVASSCTEPQRRTHITPNFIIVIIRHSQSSRHSQRSDCFNFLPTLQTVHSSLIASSRKPSSEFISSCKSSCRRATATICSHLGLQGKRAAAALSQAGQTGADQPIRTIQSAGRKRRPPTGCT